MRIEDNRDIERMRQGHIGPIYHKKKICISSIILGSVIPSIMLLHTPLTCN